MSSHLRIDHAVFDLLQRTVSLVEAAGELAMRSTPEAFRDISAH
jgi:hypothetical protein